MRKKRYGGRIIAFVMAGGEGKRLYPLTAERCKPAVPFGSRYRLVDFVLSNLINSEIRSIYLLVQYKPQSLIEHIRRAWVISPLLPDQFVTAVPPQMHKDTLTFKGTADAVYQSLRLLEPHRPDLVAVFGADHVYRMDVRQMAWFHWKQKADVTIAALPVPMEQAPNFGILATDEDGRIHQFQEKPQQPKSMPSDSNRAYASMGNYLFNTRVLVEALMESHRLGETDFGHHVLPRLLKTHRLFAYDFSRNEVPGIKPYEEVGYWRDVGTIDAYFEAHKDVLGEEPRFNAFDPQWPIFSSNYQGPVTRILGGEIENSVFGAASVVHKGARIHNSIIRREAVVEAGAELEECIIMDYSKIKRGARLRRVIVDRHNIIEPDTQIGYDVEEDTRRYHVSPSGIVVVPRGELSFYARNSRGKGLGYAE
ncbi:glucose-1-phosphate adenylyltransferase [Nitrosococcus wardiae]|uniref:Glucose-1-phosphate adenylyltransferase n=1 Tax=Nitrosococcus wardiae TaxID=1814290 RepID=A0A4P7C2D4_9GAMM|nr:glucose-1-phosphate adenylyltransferase [Nitrosococcus wardiae]QBQ55820.1 glucose-1-phosphate adenylyltransferase [Nitrosococcus wardiae]